MSKKDWKKQLLRMKQLADQNFGRSEKSEVLTDELQVLERQVNQIRDAWQSIIKKLQACLASHTGEAEKRLRKLPEYAFTNCLSDLAASFGVESILGKTFNLCSEAQLSLAKGLIQYGFEIEAKVIQPAQNLIERDIPAILKLRRQLANMTLDMDSAKSRYQALCRQTQSAASAARVDAAREELDTAEAKVEHCKDVFATEMYTFFAREDELCRMLLLLMESQSTYHRQSLNALDRLIPTLKEEIDQLATRPVFGLSLEDHLRHSKREIATVIEDCVVAILRKGLDVEGIFRIAPAASKVKKLKAAFDANMVDADEYDNDIHCFCAALKHYLRELPQPLMTFELYNDWLLASQRPTEQRLNALWVVVDKLPKHNYNNLRYLIKFLTKVAEHSELNKMSSSNLAIVFGPNLLWSPNENRNDIHTTSCLTSITEILIGSSEWFFPGDIDFPSANGSPSSTLASSSSDVSVNRSQAKVAFLAEGAGGDNGAHSGTTALMTSSSASSLLEHRQSAEMSATGASAVATNIFKPPRKIKKAAPAPPVTSGNQHQRSASVTILTSTLQDLTTSRATSKDDIPDRKVTTMTRPKVPPPARPTVSTLSPVEDLPIQSKVASTKGERAEMAVGRENVSQPRNVLDILPPFVKKPVSRSLDDVVSESRRDNSSESFVANPSYETEAVSDSEDLFPRCRSPDMSSDTALARSEGSEARFGSDEQAVVACLDNVLSEYERPLHGQVSADQPIHQVSSATEKLMEYDDSHVAEVLPSVVKCTATSHVDGQRPQNPKSQSGAVFPCKAVNVSTKPLTPEVSGIHYREFHDISETPIAEGSKDFSEENKTILAQSVLCQTDLSADHSLASNKMVAKPTEPDSSLQNMQNTPVAFQLEGDVVENKSWKVRNVTVYTDEVATSANRDHQVDVTSEDCHQVTSVADQFKARVGDSERTDFEVTEDEKRRDVTRVMSFSDRHKDSVSNYKIDAAAEKETCETLSASSCRETSRSDVKTTGECQEVGTVGAMVSIRPYKDRHDVGIRVDHDANQDSKSCVGRMFGLLGKADSSDRKSDDCQMKQDDFNQKVDDFPRKQDAVEAVFDAETGVTSVSFLASKNPTVSDVTGSTSETQTRPAAGILPLYATPAGASSTSVASSLSVVSVMRDGTSSSFIAPTLPTDTNSAGTSSSFMAPTLPIAATQPIRAGVNPAGTGSASVAMTPTGTGSSLIALSKPTTVSANSAAPTKSTDHSEMVQSLKLFFLSSSMNPDQSPTTTSRSRSSSDLNLSRPDAAASLPSMSKQTQGNTIDDTRMGNTGSFLIGGQSGVDTLSNSSRTTSTATRYSSSTDVSSVATSSRETFSANLVDPSSAHNLSQSNASEGVTQTARPSIPPPPPVRRNRPSDSSGASSTARRSTDDASNIIEDTRL